MILGTINLETGIGCVGGAITLTRDKTQGALLTVIYGAQTLEGSMQARALQYVADVVRTALTLHAEIDCFISNPLGCPPSIVPAEITTEVDTAVLSSRSSLRIDTNYPPSVVLVTGGQTSPEYSDPGAFRLHVRVHEDPDYCDPTNPFLNGVDIDFLWVAGSDPQISYTVGDVQPSGLTDCVR